MPTLLSDLINAIPVAERGDVISPESHNSIRDAIAAIITELVNLDRAIDEVVAGGVPDNSVTEQKIAANAVTRAKIRNKTLPLSKLAHTVLTGRSVVPAQGIQEIDLAELDGVEKHTFLLASVKAISRPGGPAGVRAVRLEWKLQRFVDSDADTRYKLVVQNFSGDRVEVEHKVYVLDEE
jgi:hypothetical protein